MQSIIKKLFVNFCKAFHVQEDHQILAAALKSCAVGISANNLNLGKSLHACILKLGHLACLSVSKALLNVYAKTGAIHDSQKFFNQMRTHDSVTWNILLSGLAGSQNHVPEAMRLFRAMQVGNEPKLNSVTIAIILPVCARYGNLDAGKSVHSYVVKSGLDSHTLVGNAIVSMYAKCGNVVDDAFVAFQAILSKDVVSWNAMIAGFAENGFADEAFKSFCLMLRGPVEPNYATIANILPICASLEATIAYCFGKEIHCYVLRRIDLVGDVFVFNALVSFYLRIGHMKDGRNLFSKMPVRDLVSWNAIIAGFSSNGEWSRALELFYELLFLNTVRIDSVTLVSVLPACAHLQKMWLGKQIHGYIFRHPNLFGDTKVANVVISFYAKCNDIDAAFHTFLMISRRDLISWNAMLAAFVELGSEAQSLNHLHRMFGEGLQPDSVTISTLVQLFAVLLRHKKIKEVHGYIIKVGLFRVDGNPTLENAILDGYAKCGNLEYASNIFGSLTWKKSQVSCNSIISGYVSDASYHDAYVKKTEETNLTTWNLMIRAFAENECPVQALNMVHELQILRMKPDFMTVMSILPVCAQIASLHLLKQCHGYVVRSCFQDVQMMGALLDVYSKCGSIRYAYKLFQSITVKDVIVFTAMVGAYAMHGMGEEALKVFYYMLESGIKPDHVIITTVLSACSHAGLVYEGWEIFLSMERVHGIKPTMEQYACVVDLLARGGRIEEAYSFVSAMPNEANANVWGTLLGACKTHHHVQLGHTVADHLFKIEDSDIGNYVVLSNIYAADARWDRVMEIRRLMKSKNLKKPAGCSWIEVDRRKNIFVAGDFSHPQQGPIYSVSRILDQQIKEPSEFEI
ncbi:Pentatricopeptide repeat [Dillenia turbinata]|uniref:Pentatricopeptide repeat n=1 Tax=Dillenia turbinata TaxID=194707 RepID=A0AAN8WEZ2_9MAGN